MNPQVERYLDEVCAHIRYQEVHAEVRLELESHVLDRVEALMGEGMGESEATGKALRSLGDAAVVGAGLDRAHRPRTDWKLLAATGALVLAGLWMIYAVTVTGAWGNHIGRQLLWTALGIGLGAGLFLFDYRRLQRYAWHMYGAVLVLIPLAIPWNIAWQPVWLETVASPLLFVPGLAGLFAGWNWDSRWAGWKAAGLGVVPPLLYLGAEGARHIPVYLVLWATMLLISRPRLKHLWPSGTLGAAGLGGLVWYMLDTPWRARRFLAWIAPNRDPLGLGYHVIQSRIALKEAGPLGHGLFARNEFLPQIHGDFIFPYVVHTLGWVGGGAVCLAALLFVLRLAGTARQSRNRFGFFLVAGVCAVFAMQFLWNMTMTAGWLPVASVPLPFFSAGRQQVVQLAAVGLALSVFRRKDLGRTQVS